MAPPPSTLAAALALVPAVLAIAGCDERAAAAPADAAPPRPVPSASAPAGDGGPPASGSGSAAAPVESPKLQVLKLVFTSEVKDKEPVDKIERAQPGQRVWVHLTVRNRAAAARPMSLVFRVNGDERSKVNLKIEPSWSFRTWGYNTLRASDLTGELVVDVRDESGATITTARLPIRSDGGKPPPRPKPEPEPLEP